MELAGERRFVQEKFSEARIFLGTAQFDDVFYFDGDLAIVEWVIGEIDDRRRAAPQFA
jgi:hypothetical protein